MASESRRAVYRGRVQGVGFRATTRRLATEWHLAGYVRNLTDGSVEVVASGEPQELDQFLKAIARAFGDQIQEAAISETVAEMGEPSGFLIRY